MTLLGLVIYALLSNLLLKTQFFAIIFAKVCMWKLEKGFQSKKNVVWKEALDTQLTQLSIRSLLKESIKCLEQSFFLFTISLLQASLSNLLLNITILDCMKNKKR